MKSVMDGYMMIFEKFFLKYFKSKEFLILAVVAFIIGVDNGLAVLTGLVASFLILSPLVFIAEPNSFLGRIGTSAFFLFSIVICCELFITPDKIVSEATFLIVLLSVLLFFPSISSEAARYGLDGLKKIGQIDITVLFELCLQSAYFYLQTAKAFWISFFAVVFQKMLIMSRSLSGDLPLGGLVVIFVYCVALVLATTVVYKGMIMATEKNQKNYIVKLQFVVCEVVILSALYIIAMLSVPLSLTPSFRI